MHIEKRCPDLKFFFYSAHVHAIFLFISGIGYCSIVVGFLVSLYYNVIIAWTLFYLFASFTRSVK